MKRSPGYIVLAVGAAIYILYNFVVTSFIVADIDDANITILNVFITELIVFIPVALFFIAVEKLYKNKRSLFTSVSTKTVAAHAVLLIALIVIHSVWQVYFNSLFLGLDFVTANVTRDIMGFLNLRVLIYIITIGLVVGIVKMQEKEQNLLRQSELKLKLQKTNFRELELRLNPEIIYPNLQYVKDNARENPEQTSDLILNLSKQLRILIDGMDEDRIPLRKDLTFYRYYFHSLQLRLNRSLQIYSKIDPSLLDEEIPSLVLMAPFLEELFFGKYADYTQRVEQVFYRAERFEDVHMVLSLRFQPVINSSQMEHKINSDEKLKKIEQLVETYNLSLLQTMTQADEFELTLTMKMNSDEVS